jgi:hypothetical protein
VEVFDQLAERYQGEHGSNPFQSVLIERIATAR